MHAVVMSVAICLLGQIPFQPLDESKLPKWLSKEQRQQVIDLQARRRLAFDRANSDASKALAASQSWAPWLADDAALEEGQIVMINGGKVVGTAEGGVFLRVYFGRTPRVVWLANVRAADGDLLDPKGTIVLGLKSFKLANGTTRTVWAVRRFWE